MQDQTTYTAQQKLFSFQPKSNKDRLEALIHERFLEIIREGVKIEAHNPDNSYISAAYLQYGYLDHLKVKQMLNSKIKLEIYKVFRKKPNMSRISSLTLLMRFQAKDVYTEENELQSQNRVYFKEKWLVRKYLKENVEYVLVKRNSTIQTLSEKLKIQISLKKNYKQKQEQESNRNFDNNENSQYSNSQYSNSKYAKSESQLESIKRFIDEENYTEIINDDQGKQQLPQYQQDLNSSQNQAIAKSFKYRLTFVKGPPGCGKTRTIARMLILHNQLGGYKAVTGGSSNTTNKQLLTQLIEELNHMQSTAANNSLKINAKQKIKLPKVVINYSLLATNLSDQSQEYFKYGLYPQVALEMHSIFTEKNLQQYMHAHGQNIEMRHQKIEKRNECIVQSPQAILEEIFQILSGKRVQTSFYKTYMMALRTVLAQTDILITTTVSSAKFRESALEGFKPEIAILDEASQALWPDVICFLSFGTKVRKLILVGDEKQLQPVVISGHKLNQVLKESVFAKVSTKNEKYFTLLDTQYRMKPQIAEFPSNFFYEGKIKTIYNQDPFYSQNPENQLSFISYLNNNPVTFVQHSYPETQFLEPISMLNSSTKTAMKPTYSNEFQINHIVYLITSETFPPSQMKNLGIVTFYQAQAKLLREKLDYYIHVHDLTIKTCDSYQGGQKDWIWVSTVRSNTRGESGFCKEENRVNVALTRARRSLVIWGNPQTLMSEKKLSEYQKQDAIKKYLQMTENIKENKQIQSAVKQQSSQLKESDAVESQTQRNVWAELLKHLQSKKRILTSQEFYRQFIKK